MSSASLQDTSAVVFLYTSHEQSDSEVTKTISFTTASKIIEYLRVNLTKEIQDLYTKSYKAFIVERILNDLNKWKDLLWSWI